MPWVHGRLSRMLLVSAVAHASLLLSWPASVAPVPGGLSVTLVHEPLRSRGAEVVAGEGLAARSPSSAPMSGTAAVPSAAASSSTLVVPQGDRGAAVAARPAQVPVPASPPVAGRAPVAGPALATAVSGPAPPVAQAVPDGVPQAPLAAGAPPGGGAGGEGAVGGATGADDLRQYRGSLASHARLLKRYPPLARERGWQGTVEVEVSAPGAAAPLFRVQRSSGYPVLDQQALELMARAARLAVLPDSLRRAGFRLVLPVEYRLDD